jgi:hypothetical protein
MAVRMLLLQLLPPLMVQVTDFLRRDGQHAVNQDAALIAMTLSHETNCLSPINRQA